MTDTTKLARRDAQSHDYVTLAATVDTTDLSPPERNHVEGLAEKVEQRFQQYIDGVDGVTVGEPRERDHMTQFETSHGPELVANVAGCDPDTIEFVAAAARTLEDCFTSHDRK